MLDAILKEENVQKLKLDLNQIKKAIVKDTVNAHNDIGNQHTDIQAFYLDESKDALTELLYLQFSAKHLKIKIIYKSTDLAKYGSFIFSPENKESSLLTLKIYKNEQGVRLIKTEVDKEIASETYSQLGKRSISDVQLGTNDAKKARPSQDLLFSMDKVGLELNQANSLDNQLANNMLGSFPMQVPGFLSIPANHINGFNFIQNDQKLSILMPCINFLSTKEIGHDSSSSFNSFSRTPLNKIAIGAFAIKETLESLPIVTNFLKIYDIDITWIKSLGIDGYAHFLASYAGSIVLLGQIDPATAIFSNSLYLAKEEIKDNLSNNYQQTEIKLIQNPTDFIEKCGGYMLDQSLISFANSNLDFFAMAFTAQNAAIAGIECYNLYNNNHIKNDDSYLSQVTKSIVYPYLILSSFEFLDFSDNFNAMQSIKQGISTLTSIVMIDQLVGLLVYIQE